MAEFRVSLPVRRILMPVWPARAPEFFVPGLRLAESLLRDGGELVLLCALPPKAALFGEAGLAAIEGRDFLRRTIAQARFPGIRGDVAASSRIARGLFPDVVKGNLEGFSLLLLRRDPDAWTPDFACSLNFPALLCGACQDQGKSV